MQGREEGQGREGESPEPQKGGHRSLYDRAFGGGYSNMSMDHARMPVPHHGDMLDHRDRECEEMLYHRHMAMAAQDRARYAHAPALSSCLRVWLLRALPVLVLRAERLRLPLPQTGPRVGVKWLGISCISKTRTLACVMLRLVFCA